MVNWKKRLSRGRFVAAILSAALALAICSKNAIAQPDRVAPETAGFALELFQKEGKDFGKNVLISPLSAYQALSMLLNGAAGKTAEDLLKVLGVRDHNLEGLNKFNFGVLSRLNGAKEIQLEIANAIYCNKGFNVRPVFKEFCHSVYHAEVNTLNFADPGTVDKINDWCKIKTHGKITDIVSPETLGRQMVLLNSVYLKALWLKPFHDTSTFPAEFTFLDGAVRKIPQMHQMEDFRYFGGEDFEAISLPYKGEGQELQIFLPKKGTDFQSFAHKFTRENWTNWTSHSWVERKVDVTLPKFTVRFSADMTDALQAMGAGKIFQGGDFSNMLTSGTTSVSQVLQKTYMAVDEYGTEAAAVTCLLTRGCMSMEEMNRVINFTVDRPFVAVLVDRETKEILFIGAIVDPTEK